MPRGRGSSRRRTDSEHRAEALPDDDPWAGEDDAWTTTTTSMATGRTHARFFRRQPPWAWWSGGSLGTGRPRDRVLARLTGAVSEKALE